MEKTQLKLLTESMLSLQQGNIDALETIYQLTRKGVFSFILPILHSYEAAEDIMQQTYVHLFEKINQYEKSKNPLNWILTMAKNLALTEINKINKEISTDFVEPVNGDRVFTYDSKEFDTPAIDMANQILKPDELQIVLMFAVAEYKHREIAEYLGLPLGTVTWKYNTSIKKLRKALEEKGITNEK